MKRGIDHTKEERELPNNYQSEQEYLLRCFNHYCERIEKDQKQLNSRWKHRQEVAEFLHPILSGQVVEKFDESKG